MREETQQEPICIFCKQPITQQQWPYKGLPTGEKAHLTCYLDNEAKEEKKPKS